MIYHFYTFFFLFYMLFSLSIAFHLLYSFGVNVHACMYVCVWMLTTNADVELNRTAIMRNHHVLDYLFVPIWGLILPVCGFMLIWPVQSIV